MPEPTPAHGAEAASAWVRRWSHLVPRGATLLDLACGHGRHLRWFAARGCHVTGIDRDAAVLAPLHGLAEIVIADLEGASWPLAERRFDAVVVTNYLWRKRLPDVIACLAPGGTLIYETFTIGQETIGKPSNPAFLLRPGELLQVVAGLRVVAFEDGFEDGCEDGPEDCREGGFKTAAPVPAQRFVQRIVAVREAAEGTGPTPLPRRFALVSAAGAGQVKSSDSEDPA